MSGIDRRLFLFLLTTLALLASPALYGEIERVAISWNSLICDENCARLLTRELEKIKELDQIDVNASAGIAEIKWKDGVPFSYMPINVAVRMVGVKINDIRLRVRGIIQEEGRDVALYSLGDNTRFRIVSHGLGQFHRQIVSPHPSLMELDPVLRDKILTDAEQDKIIVIEGSLYRPSVSPPFVIVVERIQVEKKQDPQSQNPKF